MNKLLITAAALLVAAVSFAAPYKVSARGEYLIKVNEGCSLSAYQDGDSWSIGFGHQCQWREPITKAQADVLFSQDMVWVNEKVNLVLEEAFGTRKVNVPQCIVDVIGDLVFRNGGWGVRHSEFARRLKGCRTDAKGNILQEDINWCAIAVRDYTGGNDRLLERTTRMSLVFAGGPYPMYLKIGYK